VATSPGKGHSGRDDEDRARRRTALGRIDQDRRIIAVKQRIGEIDPANAKSTTLTPAGSGLCAKRRATSTPKASSPLKILPIPATRNLAHVRSLLRRVRSHLAEKEEAVARHPIKTEFPARSASSTTAT